MSALLTGLAADRAMGRLRVRAQPIPPVVELGGDLLHTSVWQRTVAIGRPLAALAVYLWASASGRWAVAGAALAMLFMVTIVVVHDLMHRSLGLSPRSNDALLSALAFLLLDSGHTLQLTHTEHHRHFPGSRDPEAYLATWPAWRVLVEGPIYRYRLWWRVSRDPRNRGRSHRRLTEQGAHVVVVLVAVLAAARREHTALTAYVAVVIVGSWLFPLVSVTAVHDVCAARACEQSATMRGRVLPRLMFGMGYHLEHHLWPRIPAHHLAETARRSEALLIGNGARIGRVARRGGVSPGGRGRGRSGR